MAVERVGVIGAGLIGGSICKSLSTSGSASVRVYSPSTSTVKEVEDAGFAVERSVASLVASVDVVFICVPLDAQEKVFTEVAHAIRASGRSNIVVTDVSSVKGQRARDAVALFADVNAVFVPGHPMAGTEFSGFSASTSDLFVNATWVLCPEQASSDILVRLITLVHAMGARVSVLDIASHDAGVATISHLPYVVAASLINVLSTQDKKALALQLAAGSFRDGTRVAGSEPWLSASMVNINREEMKNVLSRYAVVLEEIATAISQNDDAAVLSFFESARALRDEYAAVKLSTERATVVWPGHSFVADALAACVSGALITSIHAIDDGWNVVLDGKDLPLH